MSTIDPRLAIGPLYTDDELENGFARLVALANERRKDPAARRAAEESVLSAQIGIDAHALGVAAFEAGDLVSAERWLKIAVDHGAVYARDDLDQVHIHLASVDESQ